MRQSCFIIAQTTSATLWAGTNSGHVSIFVLTVPAEDKRSKEKVTALLLQYHDHVHQQNYLKILKVVMVN